MGYASPPSGVDIEIGGTGHFSDLLWYGAISQKDGNSYSMKIEPSCRGKSGTVYTNCVINYVKGDTSRSSKFRADFLLWRAGIAKTSASKQAYLGAARQLNSSGTVGSGGYTGPNQPDYQPSQIPWMPIVAGVGIIGAIGAGLYFTTRRSK